MRQRASAAELRRRSRETCGPSRAIPCGAAIRDPRSPPRGEWASRGDGSRPQAPRSSRPGEESIKRPLRIVVVEDEAVIAMDIEMMLDDLGAEVMGVAATAEEAVRLAALHRPDILTMDINLKGDRDGVSAATEIYTTLGIRSLFVTAYSDEETRARAAPAHPVGWIKKPLVLDDLRTALRASS